jgi:hypothetical protein
MADAKVMLWQDVVSALDPVVFAKRCHVDPYEWQVDALRSTAPREVWVISRQCGKSTAAALLGTHALTYGAPGTTVILLSPGQRQSTEILSKVKAFYELLGKPAGATTERETMLATESGSRVISAPGGTKGATIRGYTADLLIVDEGARVSDEVFTAARAFVATTGGRVLGLSTPWTQDGWWARAAMGRDPGWTVRRVPGSDVLSPVYLASEKTSMAPIDYAREYENSFEWASHGLWTEGQWRALADPRAKSLAERLGA